jgi:hypothetical protein
MADRIHVSSWLLAANHLRVHRAVSSAEVPAQMTGAQSVQPCGCIVTRHGGHTHTKLCPPCLAAALGRRPQVYPAIPDKEVEDMSWLNG